MKAETKTGWRARLASWASGIATFAVSMWAAHGLVLRGQREAISESMRAIDPEHVAAYENEMEEADCGCSDEREPDILNVQIMENLEAVPDGMVAAWPCKGCNGCPGGMGGCNPRLVSEADAQDTPSTMLYTRITQEQFEAMKASGAYQLPASVAHNMQVTPAELDRARENKNASAARTQKAEDEVNRYGRQLALSAVISTALAGLVQRGTENILKRSG